MTAKRLVFNSLTASLIVVFGMCTAAFAASVATDTSMYAPGELVTIQGAGYMSGETVTVVVYPTTTGPSETREQAS